MHSELCTETELGQGTRLGTWLALCARMNSIEDTTQSTTQSEDKMLLGKGILGAVLGAAVGVGVMFAFYALAGFRFPLLGVGIGFLTGLAAKWLYKGGDTTLGVISGGIALAAVISTLYLMYGEFPMMSIISVIVSASVAYRIASS